MINSFQTDFDTRQRKTQQETLYMGETVDLVASLTRDGVPLSLTGCTVQGLYQPASKKGSDDWYAVEAEIVQNRVVVHWNASYQTEEDRKYYIWALVRGTGEDVAYPCMWVLDTAYSPSWPVSEIHPLPKMLDFSQYTLVNDPWLRVTHVDADTDQVAQNVTFTGTVEVSSMTIGSTDLEEALTAITAAVAALDDKVALEATSQQVLGRLDNATYGLNAINSKAALAVSNSADAKSVLENAGYGNQAIKAAVDSRASQSSVDAIKSTVDGITIPTDYAKEATVQGVATNAQTAATYSQANNNLLTSPNGLASIHATVKSKASQTSVDAIGTKVDSIKSTVEGITIPTDYAKEATLTAVGRTVDDTNTRAHSIYQYIDGVIYPLETNINYHVNGLREGTHPINSVLADILSDGQGTNTTVNGIYDVVDNGTYGNSAIKTAVDIVGTNVTSVKTTVEDNNDKLGDLATALDIINGEVL